MAFSAFTFARTCPLLVEHLDESQPAFGVQPTGIDGVEARHETVEEMAAHYIDEIKKVQLEGSYSFIGYCLSAAISMEMARQLRERGEVLGKVIVVDSYPMGLQIHVDGFPTLGERLASYGRLLANANFPELRHRIGYKVRMARHRWMRRLGRNLPLGEGKTLDSTVATTQEALAEAYNRYEWNPYEGDITLVVAGPEATRPWSRVMVNQWKAIVRGGVEVRFVSGDHTRLFEEPQVEGLAASIQECLDKV